MARLWNGVRLHHKEVYQAVVFEGDAGTFVTYVGVTPDDADCIPSEWKSGDSALAIVDALGDDEFWARAGHSCLVVIADLVSGETFTLRGSFDDIRKQAELADAGRSG